MKYARSLIAVLAALCLLGAQQAAFAHWAAHLGAPAQVTLASPDEDHAAAASLTQFCAGCAAFAGVDAALPSSPLAVANESSTAAVAGWIPQAASGPTFRHFDSRAPPFFL